MILEANILIINSIKTPTNPKYNHKDKNFFTKKEIRDKILEIRY